MKQCNVPKKETLLRIRNHHLDSTIVPQANLDIRSISKRQMQLQYRYENGITAKRVELFSFNASLNIYQNLIGGFTLEISTRYCGPKRQAKKFLLQAILK